MTETTHSEPDVNTKPAGLESLPQGIHIVCAFTVQICQLVVEDRPICRWRMDKPKKHFIVTILFIHLSPL